MKRFPPRFSLRTLAILLSLVCAYFGSWTWVADRAFKESEGLARDTYVRGGLDMGTYSYSASSRLPYVVGIDQIEASFGVVGTREYYFWFFGYVAKLPYERESDLP